MRIKGKSSNFAHAFKGNGSLAQLNRASDYGSEGCRFESCTNHITIANASSQVFAIFLLSMATVTAAPDADIKRKGGRARGHKAASQPKNTRPQTLSPICQGECLWPLLCVCAVALYAVILYRGQPTDGGEMSPYCSLVRLKADILPSLVTVAFMRYFTSSLSPLRSIIWLALKVTSYSYSSSAISFLSIL